MEPSTIAEASEQGGRAGCGSAVQTLLRRWCFRMAAEEDNPTRRRAKCPRTVVRKNAEGNAVKTYRRGECLGKGAFATVYSMKEADNAKVVAAKVVEKSRIAPGDREKLREEMRVHSSLLHAHIVQVCCLGTSPPLARCFWDS